MKYNAGMVIYEHELVERGKYQTWRCKCLKCGKIRTLQISVLIKKPCSHETGNRKQKTTAGGSEKLQAIKEKYRNGVPDGEIERWIRGL